MFNQKDEWANHDHQEFRWPDTMVQYSISELSKQRAYGNYCHQISSFPNPELRLEANKNSEQRYQQL